MALRLYDAHNHLQDERLQPFRPVIGEALERENIVKMVVNGSSEEDWDEVLKLARQDTRVVPSFGYHPWYVKERSPEWEQKLCWCLDQLPAGVGEIGLDRWIEDFDEADQAQMFVLQLHIAAQRNLPVSIHCLKAWGKLLELLQREPRPKCGFVLHSFGGPVEMIPALAQLGAYFSMPGYFAHERKARQREAFKSVPSDRLLIETDAPDQSLPPERVAYPLPDSAEGKAINHPANLGAIYRFVADLLGEPIESLASRVEANFTALFSNITRCGS